MSKQLRSVYAHHIKDFIDMKQKLGIKYQTGKVLMYQIDKLAEDKKETSPGITKCFADFWREKRPNESDCYRYNRVRYLIQFSLFLIDKGIDSYIPKLLPYKKSTFIPYIFTHEEILEIFKSVDSLKMTTRSNSSVQLFSMPVLFRVLYATGIRIGEALSLKENDINEVERYIQVSDSKNGKERIIPISESLASVCLEYKNWKSQLSFCRSDSTLMFVSPNGNKCSNLSTNYWFRKCLLNKETSNTLNTRSPRIHDLRHTFAVRSLAQMAESGVDLYASLPILSTYLGHSSIGATNHYVRLTASIYPDLINDVDQVCLDIFPKTEFYETN